MPVLPRPRPGPWFWLKVCARALFCLWLLAAVIGFSTAMLTTNLAVSKALLDFLYYSMLVAAWIVLYGLLVYACVRLSQRSLLREALERLSIKPGPDGMVWRCWWREDVPGRPLRHGLLALRGERLYGYRFGRRHAAESSLPLRAVRAFACLPPQGWRQWLLGTGPLRIFLADERQLDVFLPGAPRELPELEKALAAARLEAKPAAEAWSADGGTRCA